MVAAITPTIETTRLDVDVDEIEQFPNLRFPCHFKLGHLNLSADDNNLVGAGRRGKKWAQPIVFNPRLLLARADL